MKEHISVLMDGELFDDEADALLDKLKRDPAGHEEWLRYHLISDILRQPDHVHADISRAMHERLGAEPTILAPRSRAAQKVRWFAVPASLYARQRLLSLPKPIMQRFLWEQGAC